jgi:osmotically-inducible protein OsmY
MRPDGELEDAVRGYLRHAFSPALLDCDVVSMVGRVRLCGNAASYADKKRAAEIVAAVDGVRRVINQLRVAPN